MRTVETGPRAARSRRVSLALERLEARLLLDAVTDWTGTWRTIGQFAEIEQEFGHVDGAQGRQSLNMTIAALGGDDYQLTTSRGDSFPVTDDGNDKLIANLSGYDDGDYFEVYTVMWGIDADAALVLYAETGFNSPAKNDILWSSAFVGLATRGQLDATPRPWAGVYAGEVTEVLAVDVGGDASLDRDDFLTDFTFTDLGGGQYLVLSDEPGDTGAVFTEHAGRLEQDEEGISGDGNFEMDLGWVFRGPDDTLFAYYAGAALLGPDGTDILETWLGVIRATPYPASAYKPDLTCAFLTTPDVTEILPGGTREVPLTIANDGTAPVDDTVRVELYADGTLVGALDDLPLDLAPGESVVVNIDATIGAWPEGDYPLTALVDALDQVTESDETNNWDDWRTPTLRVSDDAPVWQWVSGDAVVSIFDVDGPLDVDHTRIAVKFGRDDSVSSITIGGDGPMTGLGITVSGAGAVGSIKDARKGVIHDLAFIASDAPVKAVALKSGMTGYDLNAMLLGGIGFPVDIDGDGVLDDANALYVDGPLGSGKFTDDVRGDVWIGGANAKGGATKTFQVKNGGYHGDMVLLGDAGKIALGGNLSSSIYVDNNLKALDIKGGDLDGPVTVDGYAGKISVATAKDRDKGLYYGGSVTAAGLVTVHGADPKRGVSLKQLATKGGGLAGDVTTAGHLVKVSVSGGDVTSTFDVGGLGAVSVKSAKDRNTGATVGGNAIGAYFSVTGMLKSLSLSGDFTDSDVSAWELAKVAVKGTISQTGGSHQIRAHAGTYKIQDATWKGIIDAANDHLFTGDLRAWVDLI